MNIKKEKIFLIKGFLVFFLVVFVVLGWTIVSKTSSEVADISLSPSSLSVEAGKEFFLSAILDTKENKAVVAKVIIEYDKAVFSLVSWDVSQSAFSLNNTCVYNEKPCEIIRNLPAEGKIIVTLAKPSPGVNVPSGLIAKLKFKALKANKNPSENIKINYLAFGNYDDSDIIMEGSDGKDLLSSVKNATVKAVLPKPGTLTAVAKSASSVDLTWGSVGAETGITGYKIFRNGNFVGEVDATKNTFSDKELLPDTSYSYSVACFDNGDNESEKTDPVIVKTPKDITSPTIPQNLSASAFSSSQINLSWQASSDDVGVIGYKIFRDEVEVGSMEGLYFEDKGLLPETEYAYQISAFDEAGNKSEKTQKVLAKTLKASGDDDEPPTVPQNVSAKGISFSEIEISWLASTDNVGVVGYKILRDNKAIGTTDKLKHKDSNLTADTSYSYNIIAFDGAGNQSEKSATVEAKTLEESEIPSTPANLKVVSVSTNSVSFSWDPSTDNGEVKGYDIYRDGTKIGAEEEEFFEDSGLENGKQYVYKIKAFDDEGNYSEYSSPLSIKTLERKYKMEDFIKLFAEWLKSGSGLISDVDGDGAVNTKDLGIMMSNWE